METGERDAVMVPLVGEAAGEIAGAVAVDVAQGPVDGGRPGPLGL